MSDQLNWHEGNYGKGVVTEHGTVHTWNEDDYELHADYIAEELPSTIVSAYFTLQPDGKIESADMSRLPEWVTEAIVEADPTTYYDHEDKPAWFSYRSST